MADGNPTPRAHDGMGAFPLPNGNIRLVRNHEDRDSARDATVIGDPRSAYDHRGGGGTTSLEVEPHGERRLVRDFVSLNGTIVNCAGGLTPWGTWITCEETTAGPSLGWARKHGYCFEVPALAEETVSRPGEARHERPDAPGPFGVPLPALGRFVHEAVAVDPRTGIVYLTEDQSAAGLYRFLPAVSGKLTLGGKLQMLTIEGQKSYDASRGQTAGEILPVSWVDIREPDPPAAEGDPRAVYRQGRSQGATRFERLEGCWFGRGSLFFNSTSGGDLSNGQVWQLVPGRDKSQDTLRLVYESPGADFLDGPDNLTVSPRGGLLICEDGGGTQLLRGLTLDGSVFDFAINLANTREFAGATYSPDGETLFVNLQGDTSSGGPGNLGRTFAIWGPWGRGPL
jgi:hypothetical protein